MERLFDVEYDRSGHGPEPRRAQDPPPESTEPSDDKHGPGIVQPASVTRSATPPPQAPASPPPAPASPPPATPVTAQANGSTSPATPVSRQTPPAPSPVRPRPPLASDPRRPARQPGHDRALAARMRPRTFDELVGQAHLVGPGKPLRRLIDRGEVPPLVLWGPSGSGRSSLARLLADHVDAAWVALSPVDHGPGEVARVTEDAVQRRRSGAGRTMVFLDQIHRCSSALQDVLLPLVENGTLLLVGSTAENPFFELDEPLVARCQLVQLNPLGPDDLLTVLQRAVTDPVRGVGAGVELTPHASRRLVALADGSARRLLDTLEATVRAARPDPDGTVRLDAEDVDASVGGRDTVPDGGILDDQNSAFVSSLRGDDPDAAVYWLLRLLEAGENPRAVARRMVVFASEDVGLADEQALPTAVAAADAVERVGLPEARLNLVHAALVLATSAKSDSVARALSSGLQAVEETGTAAVPAHLRHDASGPRPESRTGYAARPQDPRVAYHLPDALQDRHIYEPGRVGAEAAVADRLARWRDEIEASSSRLHAARGRHQGGFIEGLGRSTWSAESRQDGRGTDPRDFGREA